MLLRALGTITAARRLPHANSYAAHVEACRRNLVLRLLGAPRHPDPAWVYFHCFHIESNYGWWLRTTRFHLLEAAPQRWRRFVDAVRARYLPA